MQLAASLSDQQNDALWLFGSLALVLTTALFVAGILGSVQRNHEPKTE